VPSALVVSLEDNLLHFVCRSTRVTVRAAADPDVWESRVGIACARHAKQLLDRHHQHWLVELINAGR